MELSRRAFIGTMAAMVGTPKNLLALPISAPLLPEEPTEVGELKLFQGQIVVNMASSASLSGDIWASPINDPSPGHFGIVRPGLPTLDMGPEICLEIMRIDLSGYMRPRKLLPIISYLGLVATQWVTWSSRYVVIDTHPFIQACHEAELNGGTFIPRPFARLKSILVDVKGRPTFVVRHTTNYGEPSHIRMSTGLYLPKYLES